MRDMVAAAAEHLTIVVFLRCQDESEVQESTSSIFGERPRAPLRSSSRSFFSIGSSSASFSASSTIPELYSCSTKRPCSNRGTSCLVHCLHFRAFDCFALFGKLQALSSRRASPVYMLRSLQCQACHMQWLRWRRQKHCNFNNSLQHRQLNKSLNNESIQEVMAASSTCWRRRAMAARWVWMAWKRAGASISRSMMNFHTLLLSDFTCI